MLKEETIQVIYTSLLEFIELKGYSFLPNKYNISLEDLISVLSLNLYNKESCELLNVTERVFSTMCQKFFYEKTTRRQSYVYYVLEQLGKKLCPVCETIKFVEEFSIDNNQSGGRRGECKVCSSTRKVAYRLSHKEQLKEYNKEYYLKHIPEYRARLQQYKTKKLQRSVTWANIDKIKQIYINCPEGYEVDHWAPLQGELVSGLHNEFNLQYLPMSENRSKGHKFNPESPPGYVGVNLCSE